ncbi:MAG: BamA/TamA family outer membrane protein [Vicinamibacteria bacterium]|nr:BamA/TamA family outer membrane protein [Vicinamibacteria bacterium]
MLFWLAAALLLWPAAVDAEESRAALLERQRAAKAAALHPPERSRVETLLYNFENRYWLERLLNPPRGLFPWSGAFPYGAGIAAGPAFRHSDHHVDLTLRGAASTRGYWQTDATLALTSQGRTRVFGDVSINRREYTQEDFYGLGPQSTKSDLTSYSLRATTIGGSFGVVPTRRTSVSAQVEYSFVGQSSGRDPEVPSIEDVFTPVTAPGLGANPDLVRLGLRASLDSTDRPFGPHYGGRYTVAWDRVLDNDPGAWSFQRWNLDLRQYLPVLGSTRTLALRGQLVGVRPDAGHEVPFYLQPALGGPDSLRGLIPWRLRDRNAALLQAEYRWDLNAVLGAVLFYETGTVGPRLGDLGDWHQDWGGGLRVGLLSNVFFRAEVAVGGPDGTRLLMRFGNVF